ncbi:MAG TPA: ABC transporter ATP-binding protein [Candidatus Saccharimonas sp.]|jgi:ATP-binding cassette subfamily B protein|nr:ABC transporter ATP-binding protein [Candidatus Saccharimonas sp.]
MNELDTNPAAIKKVLQLYLSIIVRGWRYTASILITVALGSTLVFYIPPLVIAALIRDTTPHRVDELWPFIAIFGLSWLGGELLWRLALHLMIRFETVTIRALYKDALAALLQKDLSFFNNRFGGTITKNTLAFARRFEGFFDTIVFEVVSQLFPAIFAAVVLWFISPWLSFTLLLMLAVGGVVVVPLVRRRIRLVKAREVAHAEMSGHVADVVANISAVKAFGAEKQEEVTNRRHVEHFITQAARSWHYQNNRIDMAVSPLYVATNVVGLMIVLSLGVDVATKANLFIGFSYFANVTRFLWSFNSVYRRLEEAVTEASLFCAYMLEPPAISDIPNAKKLAAHSGKIDFDHITFTHSENPEALFRDFSVSINAGEKIGIVGQSGAGKSTIVSLLLRFMDIDSGTIKIDGQDISKITQQSLHQSIAYVPQEPILFHRTLRENIAYGKQDASEQDIVRAAKQANAWEFIAQLPMGLDTLVGERGVKLSGGQRQRIAIARAILKDASILVLDEATSALDSESEKLIQSSLENLMKGRTSIVIAHRLSTIAKLDRIVVLDHGSIAEDGTHEQLLAKRGIYAALWKHQSGGFIEE